MRGWWLHAIVLVAASSVRGDTTGHDHGAFAAHYTEKGTGRLLAELRGQLVRDDSSLRLRLTISATGPHVDPIRGFRGVRGANHVTARELTALVEQDLLAVVVRGPNGRRSRGTRLSAQRGLVPERRVAPDGTLLWNAQSTVPQILAVELDSGPLVEGTQDVFVEARGVPRLRVRIEVDRGVGRVLEAESLGDHNLVR